MENLEKQKFKPLVLSWGRMGLKIRRSQFFVFFFLFFGIFFVFIVYAQTVWFFLALFSSFLLFITRQSGFSWDLFSFVLLFMPNLVRFFRPSIFRIIFAQKLECANFGQHSLLKNRGMVSSLCLKFCNQFLRKIWNSYGIIVYFQNQKLFIILDNRG